MGQGTEGHPEAFKQAAGRPKQGELNSPVLQRGELQPGAAQDVEQPRKRPSDRAVPPRRDEEAGGTAKEG